MGRPTAVIALWAPSSLGRTGASVLHQSYDAIPRLILRDHSSEPLALPRWCRAGRCRWSKVSSDARRLPREDVKPSAAREPRQPATVVSLIWVEPDEGMDDENSYRAWLPPEDRLWRHPSEAANEPNPRDARNDDRDSTVERPSVPRNLGRWFHNPWARTGAVAVVAGIVGALVVSAVGVLAGAFEQQTTVVRSAVPTAPSLTLVSTAGNGLNWSGVDDAVAPSVVDVQVTTASGPVSGSGLLFEPGIGKSYVLTDSSLVAGASDIQVAVMGNQQYSGKVVGSDSLSGLAVLAVVMPTWPPTFLQVGSAADLKLGDPVMAVGAGADAPASVFTGWVGAEDREVNVTTGPPIENLIAVSGSSQLARTAVGGPLVDQSGQVVGITVSLNPANGSAQDLFYAMPIDVALHVAQQMLAGSRVTNPWLGVANADTIASAVANQYDVSGGIQVGQVQPGSPAGRMGLRAGDVIVAINGTPVVSSGRFTEILFSQGVPGKSVTIRYLHNDTWAQGIAYVTDQPNGS